MDLKEALDHLNENAAIHRGKAKAFAEKKAHKFMIDIPGHGVHIFSIGHNETLSSDKMDRHWNRALKALKCG